MTPAHGQIKADQDKMSHRNQHNPRSLTPDIAVLTSTMCYISAMSSLMLSPNVYSMSCTFSPSFQIFFFLHFKVLFKGTCMRGKN